MEKINVAELLKDCPKGMELDCTAFNNALFQCADDDGIWIEYIDSDNNNRVIYLTCYGGIKIKNIETKCIIFPKGKTTWEGFQKPFKDGDIIAFDAKGGAQLFIFKEYIYNIGYAKCYMMLDCDGEIDFESGNYYVERLATEEEKEKLFNTIKAHGYKWNPETKTLEKLAEPQFKVGDRVRNKNYKDYIYDIHDIIDKGYRAKEINADSPILILFGSQEDNYELVPNKFDITTLVPFESRVLVRDSNKKWRPAVYGFCNKFETRCAFYAVGGCVFEQCIPYEGNQHLLGTNDDCDEYFKTWK